MRPADVRAIITFNTRMGMFVCPSNRDNVVAFLHGYEYGAAGECRFIEALSQHITSRYHVKPDSLGWPHQISRLAERQSLHWMEVYLLVSSAVLSTGLTGPPPKPADEAAERRQRPQSRKRRS